MNPSCSFICYFKNIFTMDAEKQAETAPLLTSSGARLYTSDDVLHAEASPPRARGRLAPCRSWVSGAGDSDAEYQVIH